MIVVVAVCMSCCGTTDSGLLCLVRHDEDDEADGVVVPQTHGMKQRSVCCYPALCASYHGECACVAARTSAHRAQYNSRLTHNLIKFTETNRTRASEVADSAFPPHDLVSKAQTVREFDAATIVPMFAYEDVWAYYQDASSGRLLHNVGIPMLMLNAKVGAAPTGRLVAGTLRRGRVSLPACNYRSSELGTTLLCLCVPVHVSRTILSAVPLVFPKTRSSRIRTYVFERLLCAQWRWRRGSECSMAATAAVFILAADRVRDGRGRPCGVV